MPPPWENVNYTVSNKKGATDFLLQLLQILTDFHNFSCKTSQENDSHWRKNLLQHIRYVATIPCKSLRHKVIHFTRIADGFGDSVQSWCYAAALLGTRVKVNGDYYQNTVLLNMFLLDIRSVFGDYYVFQQDGVPAHRARDIVTMPQRETPEFIPPEMWPPNSPDLNPVDYSIWGMLQEKVYRSWIHDAS